MRSLYLLIFFLFCALASYSQTTRYVKVTSQSQIVDGGEYIIVAKNGESYYMGRLYNSADSRIDCVQLNQYKIEVINENIIESTRAIPIKVVINGSFFNIQVSNGTDYSMLYVNPVSTDIKKSTSSSYSKELSIEVDPDDCTISIYTDRGDHTQRYLRYYDKYIKYYTNSTGKDIYLYKKQPSIQQVSVSDVSYASFCSEYALDFTNSSITAYKGRLDGDALKLERVMQAPKNTGLILFKEGGVTDEEIPVLTEDPDPIEDNALIAATEAVVQEPGYTYYVLGKKDEVGFYPLKSDLRVPAGKAYMKIENTAGTQSAREGFAFNYDDVITSIRPVEYRSHQDTLIYNSVYNLQGQRVIVPKRGIYIVNGKKVMK